ncbi:MAG: prepilin peptidase, partial [Acidimicrobiales bacterium]
APAGDEAGGTPAPALAVVPAPPGTAERVAAAVVTGALFAGAALRFGAVPELAAYCVLFAGLVAVSVADVRVGLVPRLLVYPTLGLMAVALVGAAAAAGDWGDLLRAAIGGAVGFGVFFAIWFVAPRSMGFGDVRLAGVIGAGLGWLGYGELYLGFLVAFVVGAAVGLVKMAVQGTGRKTSLPFGPALAAGAVVGVLWGGTLANLWLHPGG